MRSVCAFRSAYRLAVSMEGELRAGETHFGDLIVLVGDVETGLSLVRQLARQILGLRILRVYISN